eukprot:m51a1_g9286 putative C-tail anchored protein (142) ;mRNA; f:16147-16776
MSSSVPLSESLATDAALDPAFELSLLTRQLDYLSAAINRHVDYRESVLSRVESMLKKREQLEQRASEGVMRAEAARAQLAEQRALLRAKTEEARQLEAELGAARAGAVPRDELRLAATELVLLFSAVTLLVVGVVRLLALH